MTLVGHSFGARLIFTCLRYLGGLKAQKASRSVTPVTTAATTTTNNTTATTTGTTGESADYKRDTESESEVGEGVVDVDDAKDSSSSSNKDDVELYRDGMIEDVVLLGMPASLKPHRWRMARAACSGRLVNGYSPRDLVLSVGEGMKFE